MLTPASILSWGGTLAQKCNLTVVRKRFNSGVARDLCLPQHLVTSKCQWRVLTSVLTLLEKPPLTNLCPLFWKLFISPWQYELMEKGVGAISHASFHSFSIMYFFVMLIICFNFLFCFKIGLIWNKHFKSNTALIFFFKSLQCFHPVLGPTLNLGVTRRIGRLMEISHCLSTLYVYARLGWR